MRRSLILLLYHQNLTVRTDAFSSSWTEVVIGSDACASSFHPSSNAFRLSDLLALIILDIKSVVLFHRLPFEDLSLPQPSTKIFRPVAVSEAAGASASGATTNEEEAVGVVEPPPKPRRAVFRWPPPKFGEALGDVDT